MDIYVGNLPYDTDDATIKSAFAEFGEVDSVKIIIDRDTGRSKGFAFVSMTNNEEGSKAIAELDGADLNGRAIKVNEARPKTDEPRQGGGGGGRQFSRGGGGGGGFRSGGGGGGGYRGGGGGGGFRSGGGGGGGHRGGRGRGGSDKGDSDWR